MEQNFETILDSLLESYEQNPEKDLNEIINEKCDEIGISEESRQLLKETNEMIDAIEEKTSSLAKAKDEEKTTRGRWVLDELERITEGRTEEEKATLISAISEANEKVIEETLTDK
jgi:hypothetical protein